MFIFNLSIAVDSSYRNYVLLPQLCYTNCHVSRLFGCDLFNVWQKYVPSWLASHAHCYDINLYSNTSIHI